VRRFVQKGSVVTVYEGTRQISSFSINHYEVPIITQGCLDRIDLAGMQVQKSTDVDVGVRDSESAVCLVPYSSHF
jgi:hypothetical protein